MISSGYFSDGDKSLFKPLVDELLHRDDYMLLADYQAYIDCQDRLGKEFQDSEQWTRMSILNVARMGAFSSDRSISEYATRIWNTTPVKIPITC